ncbi:MAG: hypothetical protein CMI18_12905, partial [Opitutaceae bacterium]|nr:hypothetical protein [Opitutaceae bacterium]
SQKRQIIQNHLVKKQLPTGSCFFVVLFNEIKGEAGAATRVTPAPIRSINIDQTPPKKFVLLIGKLC